MKRLCFVLMPFGTKTDGNKKEIDFDKVYQSFIRPAILLAGLEPVRADEEKTGGFIHKPMYERLMFCDFAVADLSFANPNVFYELGIRHALKPYTTVSIYDVATKIPFDAAPLRTFPYDYEKGKVKNLRVKIKDLSLRIRANLDSKKAMEDSPIGQVIIGYQFPDLAYLKTNADSFADDVQRVNVIKRTLGELTKQWRLLEDAKRETSKEKIADLSQIQGQVFAKINSIREENESELSANYDLLYTILDVYKSVNAFKEIALLLAPLVESRFNENIYLKQQLALAYNKIKEREAARDILLPIIKKFGPDPETSGLLGAVFKGMMDDTSVPGKARNFCLLAIDAYLQGFESDPRDYYPGVNALTLMYFSGQRADDFGHYYPLVSFAVERKAKQKALDYWVQATGFELAVLKFDEVKATDYFWASLNCPFQKWMLETTYRNILKIYTKAKAEKGEEQMIWLLEILKNMEQQVE